MTIADFTQHFDLAEEKLAAAELARLNDAKTSDRWTMLLAEAQVHATLAVAAATEARRRIPAARPFVERTDATTGNRKFTDWSGHVVAEADGAGYTELASVIDYLQSDDGPLRRPENVMEARDRFALGIVLRHLANDSINAEEK
jgi:hypothetical protein